MTLRTVVLCVALLSTACASVAASSVGSRTTAGQLKRAADSSAAVIIPDAKLIMIMSFAVATSGPDGPSDFSVSGTASIWSYIYLSPGASREYLFYGQDGIVTFQQSIDILVGGGGFISQNWIDSDSAVKVAETYFGASYRRIHPSCTMRAFLYGPTPGPTFLPCSWQIQYHDADQYSTVLVDASTGEVITGMSDFPTPPIPKSVWLGQNYPNPFNPSTVIPFHIESSSFVMLKIYDVLGREIAILHSGMLPAGDHFTHWDASDLPGGNYFYQLRTGTLVQTKKISLVR